MLLAERCDTSTSYIGEIEIGRKFPSVEMIERIARALRVAPYRLFMEGEDAPKDETEDFLKGLPRRVRRDLTDRLLQTVREGIDRMIPAD